MNREVVVLDGQTVFDIAIQEYGTIHGLQDLLNLNSAIIPSLDVDLPTGTKLQVGVAIHPEVVALFAAKKYKIASNYKLSTDAADNGIFADEFGEEFE